MENRPVINLRGRGSALGANAEDYERMRKWTAETYWKINETRPGMVAIVRYQVVTKNPQYPERLSIGHYINLDDLRAYINTVLPDVEKDGQLWVERGVADDIWTATYALVKGFRSIPAFSETVDTRVDGASVVYLQAYKLSPDEQEKYARWFIDFVCPVFMPLFMKLSGLLGYYFFEYAGVHSRVKGIVTEYPKYLSVIYFEDLEAYERFEKSPELASFHKALRSFLQHGSIYEWHVHYKLVRS